MNYRHIYMLIIEHAKSEEKLGLRKKGNGTYYEAHHILPKSLFPLWEKEKRNLVLLTAREHFFCHQLLSKIYPSFEMYCAIWYMMNDNKHIISSKEYERLKQNMCISFSKRFSGEGNPMFGRSAINEMTEERLLEYKQKMSKILSSVKRDENWRKHISLSLKCKPKSDSQREKMIETLSKFRQKAIENSAKANKGKHWFNNGKDNILAFECPDGFSKGKIQKELDEDTKAKVKLAQSNWGKGKHWFNNGKENFFGFECPDGYVAGKLHK